MSDRNKISGERENGINDKDPIRPPTSWVWTGLFLMISSGCVFATLFARDDPYLNGILPEGLAAIILLIISVFVSALTVCRSTVLAVLLIVATGAGALYLDPQTYLPLEPKILWALCFAGWLSFILRIIWLGMKPQSTHYHPALPHPLDKIVPGSQSTSP